MIEYLSEEEAEKQGTNKKVISLAEFVYGMNKETDSFSFEGLKILFSKLNEAPYTIQTDYEYWAKCWVECSFEDFLERVRENCYFRSCESTKESILEYLVEGADFISNLVTVEGLTDSSVIYYERGKKVPHKKLWKVVDQIKTGTKSMDVKFMLWDAIEQDKQTELLLTQLEESFKELKQKGYLISFSVSEKLKEFYKQIDIIVEEQSKLHNQEEKSIMKITFTYGETVKIILTQDDDGFYVYTPKNNIASSIKFFSVKGAITFFSEFLPIKAYDKEENSLSFVVTLEYKSKTISFYMKDEDKTKRAWTDYTTENKGFNDFLKVNAKVDDSIDDILRYFIKWVETITESSCINLIQKILKNTPESANDLFQLLLDFKFKVEEGIGEKE